MCLNRTSLTNIEISTRQVGDWGYKRSNSACTQAGVPDATDLGLAGACAARKNCSPRDGEEADGEGLETVGRTARLTSLQKPSNLKFRTNGSGRNYRWARRAWASAVGAGQSRASLGDVRRVLAPFRGSRTSRAACASLMHLSASRKLGLIGIVVVVDSEEWYWWWKLGNKGRDTQCVALRTFCLWPSERG